MLLDAVKHEMLFFTSKYQALHAERMASLVDQCDAVRKELDVASKDDPQGAEVLALQSKLWNLSRRSGVSGSNAAVAIGASPYRSRLELFNELSGRVEPAPIDNRFVEWGHRLESTIADKFAEFHNVYLREMDTFQSPEFPFMSASVDRFVTDNEGNAKAVLEIKTAGFNRNVVLDGEQDKLWGPGCAYNQRINEQGHLVNELIEGDSQCPPWYIAQVLHYMIASGVHEGYLAVLIGGNDYRDYIIPFQEPAAKELLLKEDEFYCKHVLDDIAPPMNASELKLVSPEPKSKIEATMEIEGLITSIKHLDLKEKEIKSQKEELKNRVIEFMGTNEALTYGKSTLATYGEQKGRTTVDTKALKEQEPETYEKFSKTGASFRVFKIK